MMELIEARRTIEVELAAIAAARRRMDDLVPLRQSLEAMDASLDDQKAFIEADTEFHLQIGRIAGHSIWLIVLQAFLVLLRPFRESRAVSRERLVEAQRQHKELYLAILNGDVIAARDSMMRQQTHSPEYLMSLVLGMPEELAQEPLLSGKNQSIV
jgi:GntR family transcriptional regulator, transcriptional repressor for pyruvate dehydrogenase complex